MFLFIQNKTAILKVTDPSKASFANYGCFCINPFVLLTLAQLRYLYRSFANVISLKKNVFLYHLAIIYRCAYKLWKPLKSKERSPK